MYLTTHNKQHRTYTMDSKIQEVMEYATSLTGVKYTWWQSGGDNERDSMLYTEGIPSMNTLQERGVNCAGFINLLRQKAGSKIARLDGERCYGDCHGGTMYWCEFLRDRNKLHKFDYTKSYPVGTLLLRDYRNADYDQGHCAVIAELHEADPSKCLYGKIIHALADDSFPNGGGVYKTNLGMSHFFMTGVDGSG